MLKRQEPSLLCSFSNYKMSEALAADCECSEWTERDVGVKGWAGGGRRGIRHIETEAKKETSRWGFS